jgi:hypothetical protein
VQDEVAKRKDKFHCKFFDNIKTSIIIFFSVSKQEIESLCTIFRHLAKGGDKGNLYPISSLY